MLITSCYKNKKLKNNKLGCCCILEEINKIVIDKNVNKFRKNLLFSMILGRNSKKSIGFY